jgi:hypothetical protein
MQSILAVDGMVRDMTIYTNIPLAATFIIYGMPSHALVDVLPSSLYGTMILDSNGYPEHGLAVVSYHPCPTALAAFWASPVMLSFGDYARVSSLPVNDVLSSIVYWNEACRG